MSVDPQLKAQFKQVVSLAFSSATANAFGEVSVGSAATVFCRLERDEREVERPDGTLARTTHRLILDCPLAATVTATPTFDMRVWLPGDSSSTPALARRIQMLDVAVDERGNVEHFEIRV